jgi:hypothetical protein
MSVFAMIARYHVTGCLDKGEWRDYRGVAGVERVTLYPRGRAHYAGAGDARGGRLPFRLWGLWHGCAGWSGA